MVFHLGLQSLHLTAQLFVIEVALEFLAQFRANALTEQLYLRLELFYQGFLLLHFLSQFNEPLLFLLRLLLSLLLFPGQIVFEPSHPLCEVSVGGLKLNVLVVQF